MVRLTKNYWIFIVKLTNLTLLLKVHGRHMYEKGVSFIVELIEDREFSVPELTVA